MKKIHSAFLATFLVESGPGKEDFLSTKPRDRLDRFFKDSSGIPVEIYGDQPNELTFSRSDYIRTLCTWIDDRVELGDDCLLIYICAHGQFSMGRYALITSDASYKYLGETSLTLHSLYHIFKSYASKDVSFLLLIDACMFGRDRFQLERLPKNVTAIFSTKAGEPATQYGDSIFVDQMIDAIQSSTTKRSEDVWSSCLLDAVQGLSRRLGDRRFEHYLSSSSDIFIPSKRKAKSLDLQGIEWTFTSHPLRRDQRTYCLQHYQDVVASVGAIYGSDNLKIKYSFQTSQHRISSFSFSFRVSSSECLSTFFDRISNRAELLSVQIRAPKERNATYIRRALERVCDTYFRPDDAAGISRLTYAVRTNRSYIIENIHDVFDVTAFELDEGGAEVNCAILSENFLSRFLSELVFEI